MKSMNKAINHNNSHQKHTKKAIYFILTHKIFRGKLRIRKWNSWNGRGFKALLGDKLMCITEQQPRPRATARVRPIGVKLSSYNRTPGRPQGFAQLASSHNPAPGRPQGSPHHTTPHPPLQRNETANSRFVVFVRAGAVRMRGWDPCGRPGAGHF